jgi:hypothetical protein
MEIAIPLLAMGGLYMISNQKPKIKPYNENFENKNRNELPNTNIADKNYPSQYVNSETDISSKLYVVNKYDSPNAYTDKYFNPELNKSKVQSYSPLNTKGEPNPHAKYYSLSGQQVDETYFQHNNMVPFFGSKTRSRNVNANANEATLDNYTGSGSQVIAKKEQAPLFSPGENYQWANGMPNSTDFIRSRVNPSNKMANVNPFEEQRVAPGLGLGYTTEGSGGFNSGMMNRDSWREKTVDELRVTTNPRSSGYLLYGREGPAIHTITQPGTLGIMEKNRPDGSFEMSSERYFTTTGLEKGPTSRAIPIDRYVTRPETSIDYSGIANHSTGSNIYIDGEHMPTHRIGLDAYPLTAASATGKQSAMESDYGIKSKVAYPNNRTQNHQENYFGAVGTVVGAAVAPLLDALRPSRKENTIGTLRPYHNPKSCVPSSYMYDPNMKLAPTIRETTENSKMSMNITRLPGGGGGAYETNDHQPIHNARDTTTDFFYSGNASAGLRSQNMPTYQGEYNQRNNDIKSSTIDGRLVPGNMNLYNGNINMVGKNRDSDLMNNRAFAPQGTSESPSIQNMGRLQGSQPLYQNINLDRNGSDMMNALQSNPYAIPYRSK